MQNIEENFWSSAKLRWILENQNELRAERPNKKADIVRFVRSKIMSWLGHVMCVEEKRIPKRILEWKPTGRRNRGRPRKIWIEGIEKDMQIMGLRGWRKMCKEREERKKITAKAKTHSGL